MTTLAWILLSVLLVGIDSQSTRCGTDWANANGKCGVTCTDSDAPCPTNEHCYADLDTTPCGNSNEPASVPAPSTPVPPCNHGYSVTNADLQFIMNSTSDFKNFVDPINAALLRYQMDCPTRIAAFLAQVRHETAGLTVFHQPADNGGGSLHMTPSNWYYLCQAVSEVKQAFADKFPNCTNCSCTQTMAASPLGADASTAAVDILANPNYAFLSGTWWFAAGSSLQTTLGWKGCGDLRLECDVGIGQGTGSDCYYTGYYQITCCVFWTIGAGSGLTQRLAYYAVAQQWLASLPSNASSPNSPAPSDHSPAPSANSPAPSTNPPAPSQTTGNLPAPHSPAPASHNPPAPQTSNSPAPQTDNSPTPQAGNSPAPSGLSGETSASSNISLKALQLVGGIVGLAIFVL